MREDQLSFKIRDLEENKGTDKDNKGTDKGTDTVGYRNFKFPNFK